MSTLYKGPSIDASYQVSVHLAEGVSEEKIKMWKVNGRQVMAKAHIAFGKVVKNGVSSDIQQTLKSIKSTG